MPGFTGAGPPFGWVADSWRPPCFTPLPAHINIALTEAVYLVLPTPGLQMAAEAIPSANELLQLSCELGLL